MPTILVGMNTGMNEVSAGDDTQLGHGGPRLSLDHRGMSDEAHIPTLNRGGKTHSLLDRVIHHVLESSLRRRLSPVLPIVADEQRVPIDRAADIPILAWKIGEALQSQSFSEIDHDLMRVRTLVILPGRVPHRGRPLVDRTSCFEPPRFIAGRYDPPGSLGDVEL